MTMTKKEQTAFAVLRENLALAKALRWTEEVEYDVSVPANGNRDLAIGFSVDGIGEYARVEESCSSSVFHAMGRQNRTDSQYPIRQFSSKLLALKHLRNQIENECARRLASIDAEIKAEQGATK